MCHLSWNSRTLHHAFPSESRRGGLTPHRHRMMGLKKAPREVKQTFCDCCCHNAWCNLFIVIIYSKNGLDSRSFTLKYTPNRKAPPRWRGDTPGWCVLVLCAQPELNLTLELFICGNNKTICLSFSLLCAMHHRDNKMQKMYLNCL